MKTYDDGLVELSEVSMFAPTEVLREIGQFMVATANRIDSESLEHVHIKDEVADWQVRFPAKDIVVGPKIDYDWGDS